MTDDENFSIGVALARAPQGSYLLREVLRVEVRPDLFVETMAIRTPDSVMIPFRSVLPDGGFARGLIEVDPRTYDKVLRVAERLGGVPVIRGLIERYAGDRLDVRARIPPR